MIQEGLLWFDDSPARTIADKITNAVAHYRQKYGKPPDVCFVNPGQMPTEGTLAIGPVKVHAAKTVLLHHFWLGVEKR